MAGCLSDQILNCLYVEPSNGMLRYVDGDGADVARGRVFGYLSGFALATALPMRGWLSYSVLEKFSR
jgi:hypothetical protein